ncbi:hypothetical protein [Streptomyces sp. NPDC018584]|uniref:hypothetical protein n=1 Tax=unclassified Streptomyces TaxID=2593676 RepID=UPI0037B2DE7E
MKSIDPLQVKAGDIIQEAYDEDDGKNSCHCSFVVKVGSEPRKATEGSVRRVAVIAHGLKPGDIIQETFERGDEGNCHCDVYFLIDRVY